MLLYGGSRVKRPFTWVSVVCAGVWHTVLGRSLLRLGETPMADVFAANGYRTGMFGKWHLGDSYPFRPHQLELEENTILIFLSDNGTEDGAQFDEHGYARVGFNAGMRAQKISEYEGGTGSLASSTGRPAASAAAATWRGWRPTSTCCLP